jgi:hypothetical protein
VLFAVKVTSDKQTLILAGEPIPPRRNAGTGAGGPEISVQLRSVAMLLVLGDYVAQTAVPSGRVVLSAAGSVVAPAVSTKSLVPSAPSSRFLSAGAAEYVRTQNLSHDGTRSQLIDTYA